MPLLPPRVAGPLSECSSAVRVKGQISGSSVEIFADGVSVGGGVAGWSNQIFTLDPGAVLASGAKVTATQAFGGETSPSSPEPVEVQSKPPVIGTVGFRSHLYVCGKCLWLDGMVPGATVEVRVGTIVYGSGTAHDGQARIGLSSPIGPGEILEAQQTACGEPGIVTESPPPDFVPAGDKNRLSPPEIVAPLKECQRAVTVKDVFEGSLVTLSRTGGPNLAACFDAKSLWFRVDPLVLGETVTARQEYPACELASPDSTPITVESADPVPPPTVLEPLCDGAVAVTVIGLLPGSKVKIFQDGVELGLAEAPDQDAFEFPVAPPLTGGATITAQQELCDIWSADSNKVEVNPRPASLPKPTIPKPLFECASVVRVKNLHPGAAVYVYSEILNAPIGWKQVFATETDVPVAPFLIVGDNVFAVQVGCGLTSSKSDPVLVEPLSQLRPPSVQAPLDDCMRAVPVIDVVPGARVDIYVNGNWRGSKDAGEATVVVPIFGRLQEDDQVRARQRICGIVTELSKPVSVSRNTTGYWEGPFDIPVLAVHGALVYRPGADKWKVLMFSGGEEANSPPTGASDLRRSYLLDPETNEFSNQPFVLLDTNDKADPFCAHNCFLPDGRILVMGGALYGGSPARGIKATWIFDPASETWDRVGDMGFGRWYPTSVVLPDGKVLVFSGWDENQEIVSQVEIFDPNTETWSPLPSSANKSLEIYPSMHLVPSGPHAGKIFYSGTRWASSTDANSTWSAPDSMVFDPSSNLWANIAGHVKPNRSEGMSVLLPPAQDSRFLVMGGGHEANRSGAGAAEQESAEIINLTDSSPSWALTPDMDFRRTNVNAVILPDGTVFVSGGHQKYKFHSNPDPVLQAEIYIPDIGTGSWTPAASMQRPRQYHSVAILLPDGRILTAGGILRSPNTNQFNMEFYYPPYLCRASRPEITSAPKNIYYNRAFTVGTPQADSIDKVVLIRPTAVTHHTNSEQRYVLLDKEPSGTEQLQATAPNNANLAPPGYYMLFIVNGDGTPSVAKFVRLSQPLWPWWRDLWELIVRAFRWFFGR